MNSIETPTRSEISHIELPTHKVSRPTKDSRRPSLDVLNNVSVELDIRLGTTTTTVKQLLELQQDSLLELTQHLQQDVDVLLNGKIVARGQIVAIDNNFGVCITEIAATK